MGIHLYWVSALTYVVVLGVLLYSERRATMNTDVLEKSYREMLIWVIFFCAQDAIWGLCEASVIKGDVIFFISSSIFHISTVITTFFWLKYVLDYLGEKVKNRKLYLVIDAAIICAELIFVIVNFFHTTLFKIVDGNYVTGKYRPGFIALVFSFKK